MRRHALGRDAVVGRGDHHPRPHRRSLLARCKPASQTASASSRPSEPGGLSSCACRARAAVVAAASSGRAGTRAWMGAPLPPPQPCDFAGLPERLGLAVVRPAAEDEQQVREPVEVAHDLGVDSSTSSARRSARRQTVRQTCSCAAAGVPPGRMKDFSGSSVALTSSQAPSSQVALLGADAQALAVAAVGHREVGADVEEVVLDAAQPVAVAARAGPARSA